MSAMSRLADEIIDLRLDGFSHQEIANITKVDIKDVISITKNIDDEIEKGEE